MDFYSKTKTLIVHNQPIKTASWFPDKYLQTKSICNESRGTKTEALWGNFQVWMFQHCREFGIYDLVNYGILCTINTYRTKSKSHIFICFVVSPCASLISFLIVIWCKQFLQGYTKPGWLETKLTCLFFSNLYCWHSQYYFGNHYYQLRVSLEMLGMMMLGWSGASFSAAPLHTTTLLCRATAAPSKLYPPLAQTADCFQAVSPHERSSGIRGNAGVIASTLVKGS